MLDKLVSFPNSDKRCKHYVVSLSGNGVYGHHLSDLGVPVYCLKMKEGRFGLLKLSRLYGVLKRIRPHILQTWLYHTDLLGLLFGKLLPDAPRIVWNVRCSNVEFEHYAYSTRLVFSILSLLSRLPDTVIANSITGKRSHIKDGYNPKKWALIPNGFDMKKFVPDSGARSQFRSDMCIAETDFTIGMVARYDPMKGHTIFLSAAEKLIQTFPDVRFVLAGEGLSYQNNELQRVITSKGLKKKTLLIGRRNDIHKIYPAFDLSTLSSFGEGFPNVLGESMACGVPCVSTAVGDAADIIADTGIVVPPGNSDALATAWMKIISLSPEQRSEMGLRARERIEDNYSLSKVVQQYEGLYMGCWNGKHKQKSC